MQKQSKSFHRGYIGKKKIFGGIDTNTKIPITSLKDEMKLFNLGPRMFY